MAAETNPRAIEKWGKVPVLATVADRSLTDAHLPPDILAAISQVDWERLAQPAAT